MDLIIKNLEKLQEYHTKEGKHPIERLVLDFDKLSEMEGFTKIFEKSCEKYVEVGGRYLVPIEDIQKEIETNWKPKEPIHKEVYVKMCANCKFCEIDASQEPCRSCWGSMEGSMGNRPNNWKPSEPTLKELYSKYGTLNGYEEPCNSCLDSTEISPNWEPKEPTLKEATERMQSEFDATGKDVKIFMNERIIKK